MKRTVVVVLGVLLLMPAGFLWASIAKTSGTPSCNGVPALTPGTAGTYYVEGPGVDLTSGLTVSNPALTATLLQKWNGAQNAAAGGNVLWGKISIKVTASASAPAGNHIVYINYPVGKDNLTVRVTGKVTAFSAPAFSEPFATPTVKLTGTGLKNAGTIYPALKAAIVKDASHPLLDAYGKDVTEPVSVFPSIIAGTNTDTQMDVTLNFQRTLTAATVTIYLTSSDASSGLSCLGGTSYTLSLTAPKAKLLGYVIKHTYDKPYAAYKMGDVVNVTVLLDSPVCAITKTVTKTITPPTRTLTPTCHEGGTLYWGVTPAQIAQAGSTPYNPALQFNSITVPALQQSAVISFKLKPCVASGQSNGLFFMTRKPNSNDMNAPNHLVTGFSYACAP